MQGAVFLRNGSPIMFSGGKRGNCFCVISMYSLAVTTNMFSFGTSRAKRSYVFVIPSSFGWSDLGTWNSAWENMQKDYLDNAVAGKNVIVFDTTKCVVNVPDGKLVVLQGLEDYIVADTKDVLLICCKDKEQEIKEYVAEVKRNTGEKFL